jgi:hypothetical protein
MVGAFDGHDFGLDRRRMRVQIAQKFKLGFAGPGHQDFLRALQVFGDLGEKLRVLWRSSAAQGAVPVMNLAMMRVCEHGETLDFVAPDAKDAGFAMVEPNGGVIVGHAVRS